MRNLPVKEMNRNKKPLPASGWQGSLSGHTMYEYESHHWKRMKGIGYDRCIRCGLLALKNPFSQWCIKMGCDHTAHPRYPWWITNCRLL